ncbi:MAG: hypothetical protein R3266_07625, partial [Gemmatimonadota bacterium]|nr:hypothetical protein [Gemmatimonadota bacterium]
MNLRVKLFGPVEVREGAVRRGPFPTRKAKGLFAYLVLNRSRAHTREKLAGTFWSDKSERAARSCLRTALWRVRGVLEPDGVSPGTYLRKRDHTLQFTAGPDFELDVAQFEDRVRRADVTGDEAEHEPLRRLQEAVELYRGDLL